MASRTALAPAKVNLFLHVGAAKPNGRHDLDSLVVFSDDRAGDHVTVEVADTLTLDAAGPFASASGPLPDNLVLRAAEAGGQAGEGEEPLAGEGDQGRLVRDRRPLGEHLARRAGDIAGN